MSVLDDPRTKMVLVVGGGLALVAIAIWVLFFRKPDKGPSYTGGIQGSLGTSTPAPEAIGRPVSIVSGTTIGLGPGPVLVTHDPITGVITGVVSPSRLVG